MPLPVQGPTDGAPGSSDRTRYGAHTRTAWGTFLQGLRLAPGGGGDGRRRVRLVSSHGTVYAMGDFVAGGGFGRLYRARPVGEVAAGEPARFVVKVFDTWDAATNDMRGLTVLTSKRQGRNPVTEGSAVWPDPPMVDAMSDEEFDAIVAEDPRKGRAYIAMPAYSEDPYMFLCRVHTGARPPLTEAEACSVVGVVAQAAARLWAAGIMVTDVKTGNIMVHYRGCGKQVAIRLVDHGCFKDRTKAGAYNTTYCPPEHVHYYEAADARVPCEEASLVWQLGILLVHLLQPSLQYTSAGTYGELFNKWTQSTSLGEAMKGWEAKDAFLRTMWGHVLSIVRSMLSERGASEGLVETLMYALRSNGVHSRPTLAGLLQCVKAV